ncbi:hypothetical protein D3C86_1850910 [compost metagenome]
MGLHRAAEKADVATARRLGVFVGEIGFAGPNSLGRKLEGLPIVEIQTLAGRAPDRRRRGDHLVNVSVARAEPVDGGLVKTHDGSQRSRDQMQLVLNDQ